MLRDVVGYWLTFSETGEAGPDAPGSWFRARAEPISDKAPSAGTPLWPTRLNGDGWVASWLAYRPVVGQVQVPLDALRSAPSNQTPGWRNRAARGWLSHTLVLLNPPDGGYEQVELGRAWYGHAH